MYSRFMEYSECCSTLPFYKYTKYIDKNSPPGIVTSYELQLSEVVL